MGLGLGGWERDGGRMQGAEPFSRVQAYSSHPAQQLCLAAAPIHQPLLCAVCHLVVLRWLVHDGAGVQRR